MEVFWWSNIAWAAGLLADIAGDRSRNTLLLNSDQLYVPALVEDIFHWSGTIRDWSLTPSPYFFPDALLYMSLRGVGLNVEWASYLADAIQFLGIAFIARSFVHRGLHQSRVAAALIAPAFPLLLCVYPKLAFVESLFRITRHVFVVWLSLFTLELCLRPRERHARAWTVLGIGLAGLIGVSDPLCVVSYAAPLVVITAIELAKRRSSLGARQTLQASRCIGSAVAATLGAAALRLAPGNAVTADHTQVRLDQVSETLLRIQRDFPEPLLNDALLGTAIIVAAATVVLSFNSPKDAPLRRFAYWCVASLLFSVAAMVGSGHYVDIHSLRYVVVPWTTGVVLIFATALRAALPTTTAHDARWFRVATLVSLCCLLGTLMTRGTSIIHGQYTSEMRAAARCVAEIAHDEGCDYVLADYWHAKPLQLFSDGALRALQVDLAPLRPRIWINSRGWYRGLESKHGNVLVANNLPLDILNRYGRPARVEQCHGLEVRVYRGKPQRRLFNEFRAQLKQLEQSERRSN